MRRAAPYVILLLAFLVALLLDKDIAGAVHYSAWPVRLHPKGSMAHLAWVVKLPGVYYFTLVVAAIVALTHRPRLRGAALLCLSGGVAALFYSIIKWMVGRTRPYSPRDGAWVEAFHFHPFIEGLWGLFHAVNLAFPSGHTCLAFASAAALGYLLPRYRLLFFAIATLTAAERVLEGAHYPSDVVAGAALGIFGARATRPLLAMLWPEQTGRQMPSTETNNESAAQRVPHVDPL